MTFEWYLMYSLPLFDKLASSSHLLSVFIEPDQRTRTVLFSNLLHIDPSSDSVFMLSPSDAVMTFLLSAIGPVVSRGLWSLFDHHRPIIYKSHGWRREHIYMG